METHRSCTSVTPSFFVKLNSNALFYILTREAVLVLGNPGIYHHSFYPVYWTTAG